MKLLTNKDKNLRKKLFSSEAREIQLRFLRNNLLNSPLFESQRESYRYFFNKKTKNKNIENKTC